MNSSLLFIAAALTLSVFNSAAAPVSIPAPGVIYTQNFNTLATAANNGNSNVAWTDDVTLPGWFLYRAGNGSPVGFAGGPFTYRVADGTAAPSLGQFHSMGAAGNTDRALGGPSTTSQGELSAIVVFRNTATTPVELTRLKHKVEVLRTNDGANNLESIFVWWRTASSLAEIKTITTAAASNATFPSGASSPSAHYITGWNRFPEAEVPYSNATASQVVNVSLPVDAAPASPIRIAPGEFLAVRYSNINDAGADALMGIDDVEITFTPIAAAVEATVSDTVRHDNGTPANPMDDTVDFKLTVAGVGNVSPAGWVIQFPPFLTGQTGAYNTPRMITGVPLSEFSNTGLTTDFYLEDVGNPALWDLLILTAPGTRINPVITNITRDDRGSPENPFDDLWSYTLLVNGQFGGSVFTSDNSSIPDSPYGTSHTVAELPIGLGFQTTVFTDTFDMNVSATVTAYAPRILGIKDLGTAVPLYSGPEGVDGGWAVDEGALTQTMTSAGGGASRTFSTEILNLAGTGGARFSANLRAVDTSSGFEDTDSLTAHLVINGNTRVDLLAAYDTNRNGEMNGGSGASDDEFNARKTADGSYTSDFPLSYVVPSTASTVQLIVSGINDSSNETFIVQNIRFETGGDSDGDGMSDLYEDGNGLNKNSAADRDLDRDGDGQSNLNEFLAGTAANSAGSVLKITGQQWNGETVSLTWTSVPGRTYRVDYSTGLSGWTDAGSDFPAASGAQTTASVVLPGPLPGAYYLRVRVK